MLNGQISIQPTFTTSWGEIHIKLPLSYRREERVPCLAAEMPSASVFQEISSLDLGVWILVVD